MRVGLVIYGNLDIVTGGFIYDRKLVEYLRKQGDEVFVIAIPWRRYIHHLIDNFSTPLRKQLKELQVDILLEDELNHPSLFILNRWLKKRVNYPVYAIVHHLRSREHHNPVLLMFYRYIERLFLSTVDGVVSVSQTTLNDVRSLGIEPPRSLVAYPAADRWPEEIKESQRSRRSRRPTHAGALKILFLGSLIPRKCLDLLIRAIAQLPPDDFFLEVVGDPDVDAGYASRMKKLAGQLLERGSYEFTGRVAREELPAIMQAADVLVVPSDYEGFGMVYLEGMGFGLPAIASRSGAAHEIIDHGVNGYLIPSGDWRELARYLSDLHNNADLLATMSQNAVNRYKKHPVWMETTTLIRAFLLESVHV